jgi:hypothetical protein
MRGRGNSGRKPKPKDPTAKSRKFADDREPYERQPWERDEAWGAFVLYRDMGPERTIRKVSEQRARQKGITDQKKIDRLYVTTLEYSARNGWRSRVDSWELNLDRERRKRQIKSVLAMRERHSKLGQGMQNLGGHGLKKLLDKAKAGQAVKLAPCDIKNLIDLGIRIEREANNEPGTIVEERQKLSADEEREELRDLYTDPEARDAARQLLKKLNGKND